MKKLFLKKSLLIVAMAMAITTKAQKSDSTVTIIFAGEKNKGSYKASKKKDVDANNIIKVAPTGIFVGQNNKILPIYNSITSHMLSYYIAPLARL
jgi:hypothetical protein